MREFMISRNWPPKKRSALGGLLCRGVRAERKKSGIASEALIVLSISPSNPIPTNQLLRRPLFPGSYGPGSAQIHFPADEVSEWHRHGCQREMSQLFVQPGKLAQMDFPLVRLPLPPPIYAPNQQSTSLG